MTEKELDQALLNGKPVVHNDIRLGDIKYKCVCEVVKYRKGDEIKTSAILMDYSGRSFIRVMPERLRYAKGE